VGLKEKRDFKAVTLKPFLSMINNTGNIPDIHTHSRTHTVDNTDKTLEITAPIPPVRLIHRRQMERQKIHRRRTAFCRFHRKVFFYTKTDCSSQLPPLRPFSYKQPSIFYRLPYCFMREEAVLSGRTVLGGWRLLGCRSSGVPCPGMGSAAGDGLGQRLGQGHGQVWGRGLGPDPVVKIFRQVACILVKVARIFKKWIANFKCGSYF
jgi:hypothetical protein